MFVNPYLTSEMEKVFPKQWQKGVSKCCKDVGMLAGKIGHLEPSLTLAEKASLNQLLNMEEENGSLLPEEICRSVLDIAGGTLYSIGWILHESHFVTPINIASLVRSILEHASLILFLNEEDKELRCARALKTVINEMKNEGACEERDMAPLYSSLRNSCNTYTSAHRGVVVNYSNYMKLVDDKLSSVGGQRVYRTLSQYVHHSSWVALCHEQQIKGVPNELMYKALCFAAIAAKSLIAAIWSLLPYRKIDSNPEVLEQLESSNHLIHALDDAMDFLNLDNSALWT